MKTKIRTFAGIVVLGFIGFININAAFVNTNIAAAPKGANNFKVVIEQEEVLTIESWMLENKFWTPKSEIETMDAEALLTIDSWMLENELWAPKSEIETMEAEKSMVVEGWMTNLEFFLKSGSSAALCASEKMGR